MLMQDYKLQTIQANDETVVNVVQDGMLVGSFKRNSELSLLIDIDEEFVQEVDLNVLFAQVLQALD